MKEYNFPNVIRHVYDVDAFEVLDAMKVKLTTQVGKKNNNGEKQLEMLKIVEESLIKDAQNFDLDILENQKYRNFVLPSSSILYHTFLVYKLLTFDVYKIGPMLSFQSKLFLGNYYAVKDNFVGLVEYTAYESVKNSMFSDKNLRLEKIVNWVESKNNDYNYSIKSYRSSEIENKFIKADGEYIRMLHGKLKPFFEIKEEKALLFDALFSGKVISELSFYGQANQFVEFFKRLKYNDKIFYNRNKDLAEWICLNFKFRNRKTGEFENFSNDSVLQILKNSTKEPRKFYRILGELATFKIPKKRLNEE